MEILHSIFTIIILVRAGNLFKWMAYTTALHDGIYKSRIGGKKTTDWQNLDNCF